MKDLNGKPLVCPNSGSNRDYNDFVISLGGIQTVDVTNIQDVIASNRNWTNTAIGTQISNYFFNNVKVE
ncbi:hypothetical protein NIES22_46370 [Calothrix brevissima NIES-22]|nr:hypothetical protein NIES22_46370 [Calothrix brevissima NIES-22]